MPRAMPGPERFVELLNQFAQRRNLDPDTQAIPLGGSRGDGEVGLSEWVKIHERCMPARATEWLTTTALADEPPFYLARMRDGQLTITRPNPGGPTERIAMTLAQLKLCDPDVASCVHLDMWGGFYNKITQAGVADTRRHWLITPEGLSHLISQGAQLAREIAETKRAQRAAEDATADRLGGQDLDLIRGLLMAAGVDITNALDVTPSLNGAELVAVSARVKADGLHKLGTHLASLGVQPVTRAEAADNLVIVGEHHNADGPTGEPTTKVNVTRAEWAAMDQTGWTIIRDPRQATAPESGGYAWTEWLATEMDRSRTRPPCPDGATCHHGCADTCTRVRTCEPLSGVFPGNTWPESVHARHTRTPAATTSQAAPKPVTVNSDADAERLRKAQQDRLDMLRDAAADKPAHARFLGKLVAAARAGTYLDDVEREPDVSQTVANALITDVTWCRQPAPRRGQVSPYPNAYDQLRLRQARAVRNRRENQAAAATATSTDPTGPAVLHDVLNLNPTEGPR